MADNNNLSDPTVVASIAVELLKQAHELMIQSLKVPNARINGTRGMHYDEIISYIYDGRFATASRKLRDFYQTWIFQ